MTAPSVAPMPPRFFIDHGMIHDRVTGKHVTTDEDSIFCDGIDACCALLNDLAAPGSSPQSPAPSALEAELLSIARRFVALDGGAWNVERHAKAKAELKADALAAITRAEGRQA